MVYNANFPFTAINQPTTSTPYLPTAPTDQLVNSTGLEDKNNMPPVPAVGSNNRFAAHSSNPSTDFMHFPPPRPLHTLSALSLTSTGETTSPSPVSDSFSPWSLTSPISTSTARTTPEIVENVDASSNLSARVTEPTRPFTNATPTSLTPSLTQNAKRRRDSGDEVEEERTEKRLRSDVPHTVDGQLDLQQSLAEGGVRSIAGPSSQSAACTGGEVAVPIPKYLDDGVFNTSMVLLEYLLPRIPAKQTTITPAQMHLSPPPLPVSVGLSSYQDLRRVDISGELTPVLGNDGPVPDKVEVAEDDGYHDLSPEIGQSHQEEAYPDMSGHLGVGDDTVSQSVCQDTPTEVSPQDPPAHSESDRGLHHLQNIQNDVFCSAPDTRQPKLTTSQVAFRDLQQHLPYKLELPSNCERYVRNPTSPAYPIRPASSGTEILSPHEHTVPSPTQNLASTSTRVPNGDSLQKNSMSPACLNQHPANSGTQISSPRTLPPQGHMPGVRQTKKHSRKKTTSQSAVPGPSSHPGHSQNLASTSSAANGDGLSMNSTSPAYPNQRPARSGTEVSKARSQKKPSHNAIPGPSSQPASSQSLGSTSSAANGDDLQIKQYDPSEARRRGLKSSKCLWMLPNGQVCGADLSRFKRKDMLYSEHLNAVHLIRHQKLDQCECYWKNCTHEEWNGTGGDRVKHSRTDLEKHYTAYHVGAGRKFG
ncbi:hypothetical protein D9758_009030 [Tetrapyrgos nigripes]|uniref:Uncharacterized protein n=1 Tax=Tetrapyrgos nigripes TaxID=182062 RepID=A0A8H5GAD1_9AGAR|nr:hypothetical protein D9758_009030 [Tetrapyrgos nigripes]